RSGRHVRAGGLCGVLRNPDRDADPAEDGRHGLPARARRRVHRGGTDDVDANLETVRLLRSQLRTKSPLRVIEAEVLPLAEIATTEASRDNGTGITNSSAGVVPPGQIPTANVVNTPEPRPNESRPSESKKNSEPTIKNEKDLAKFDKIFADVAYWKKLGE